MSDALAELVSLSRGGALVIVLPAAGRYAARWRCRIWLALCLLVRCIHWFNPAVWYMGRLVERDTEPAWDEAVLRHRPPDEHDAYGETILRAAGRLNTRS